MDMMEEYLITSATVGLFPNFHPWLQTKTLDWDGEFYIEDKPLDAISNSCLHYGASYEGRKKSIVHRTNFKQKTPMIISEAQGMIMIPTHSPDHMYCAWLMYHHIHKVIPNGTGCTILFHNNVKVDLTISAAVMRQQMQKAAVIYNLFCTDQKINFSFMMDPKKRKKRKKEEK
ncbi:competence protein ComK [Sutcliffiella sp. NC1]|uniref:competence protein ComK n=1 Tax=Sutcliffiella sp. NC1 TaxID=3004096 RepID=UPI0022DD9F60|nr:competence protein ComK [Sutcliffiella sp. NC1]WBL14739.1 competence protein ComK [Sutcliffiella sp. NC1]